MTACPAQRLETCLDLARRTLRSVESKAVYFAVQPRIVGSFGAPPKAVTAISTCVEAFSHSHFRGTRLPQYR
jgi:hypothetical protein